jgi:N-acetylneuraminic acid mutarotase
LLPNGEVLVEGGLNFNALASAELYDPASGTWTVTGSLAQARRSHTATLLPNGKVLVAAGFNGSNFLASAELYDSADGSWTATGDLGVPRAEHTATLLPNGQALVTGGTGNDNFEVLASAQLYYPPTGMWKRSRMNLGRRGHTATLLPNRQVLVTGGAGGGSAELYDPTARAWTFTSSLGTARWYHTATLLPNGQVLVAGGLNKHNGLISLDSAELYDPATGMWAATDSLATGRSSHTATLLPNGQVLVAGGYNDLRGGYLASVELYDPANGVWAATGGLATGRSSHTATLLLNGLVLVAGGYNALGGGFLASAELYDPATGMWTATGSMANGRYYHTATLLPNGQVLVAGGFGTTDRLASAELYDVGLGFVTPDWQPQIATATSSLELGSSLMLTGSRFQGISQASGGNFQDSSTNYPVVQLRSIDNSQIAFLPVDPIAGWSDTAFTSTPVNNFPPGPALVTVFTNGIPSDSKSLMVVTATGNSEAH